MHDALDGGRGGAFEQSDGRRTVNALGVVARGPLQDADAIDQRVDPLEALGPKASVDVSIEVACDPFDVREDAAGDIEIAAGADHGPALVL